MFPLGTISFNLFTRLISDRLPLRFNYVFKTSKEDRGLRIYSQMNTSQYNLKFWGRMFVNELWISWVSLILLFPSNSIESEKHLTLKLVLIHREDYW